MTPKPRYRRTHPDYQPPRTAKPPTPEPGCPVVVPVVEFTITADGAMTVTVDGRPYLPEPFAPGWRREAFPTILDALTAQGYAVLGISPDAPAKLAKFRAKEGLTIALLSDPDKAVHTAYGAYGEKKLYGKTVVGVIRSTFVVDADGTVADARYNVKATGHVAKRRHDLGL